MMHEQLGPWSGGHLTIKTKKGKQSSMLRSKVRLYFCIKFLKSHLKSGDADYLHPIRYPLSLDPPTCLGTTDLRGRAPHYLIVQL